MITESGIILFTILVISVMGIVLAIVTRRQKIQQRKNETRIQEHKDAMVERIAEEDGIRNYSPLDYGLFQEHKEALVARISDEDWFEKFIGLLFARRKKSSIVQAFIQRGSKQDYELDDILSLSRLQPVLIIGDAGSGKTTSLRKIAVDLCGEAEEIPLLLNLATYQSGQPLIEMMNTERQLDKELIKEVFRHGKATVLVDQLNEIRENQDIALDALNQLMTEYKGNRYIIAVRTSGYLRIRSKTEAYIAVEVEPLTINKISTFLENYLGKDSSKKIVQQMDDRLRGLCSNPLMLSMIASVYEAEGTLPHNRSNLYDSFLYQLLHNWDQKTRHSILAAYIDEVLAYTCYHLNPTVTAHSMTEIQNLVAQCVPALNQKYSETYTTNQISEMIKLVAVTKVDRVSYKLFFIHQSIQEFYAAKYMYSRITSDQNNVNDYRKELQDADWIEPIFFLCGLLPDATDLIEKLFDMNRIYMAAQCVQNAVYVRPSLVDDLIVFALTEFKYGDDEVGEQEAVSYDLIRALRIAAERKSSALSQRLLDDMQFFMTKYSSVREHYAVIPEDDLGDADLVRLISSHDNQSLEPDYVWNLGKRQSKLAADLLRKLAIDKTYEYRDEAIWSLGEIGDDTETNALIELVDGKQPSQVVVAACNALIRSHQRQLDGRSCLNKELAVKRLKEYIEDLDNPNREAAGWALSQIAGLEAKDTIIKHMSTGENYYQRAMFVWLTGELGITEAVDKLVSMYPIETEAHVREDIVFALGDLGAVMDESQLDSATNPNWDLSDSEVDEQLGHSDVPQESLNPFKEPQILLNSTVESSKATPNPETITSPETETGVVNGNALENLPDTISASSEASEASPQNEAGIPDMSEPINEQGSELKIEMSNPVNQAHSDVEPGNTESSSLETPASSEDAEMLEDESKPNMKRAILTTLYLALKDSDAVVRMQAVNALAKIGDESSVDNIRDMSDNNYFVNRAVEAAIQNLTNGKETIKMTNSTQISTLNSLSAKATALANRLAEIDEQYKGGYIDIGRYTQLKTSVETDRLKLLLDIEDVISGTEMAIVEPAIAQAKSVKPGEDDKKVREELRKSVEKKSWGETFIQKIEEYKGEIVGLIVSIAIEVGKRSM